MSDEQIRHWPSIPPGPFREVALCDEHELTLRDHAGRRSWVSCKACLAKAPPRPAPRAPADLDRLLTDAEKLAAEHAPLGYVGMTTEMMLGQVLAMVCEELRLRVDAERLAASLQKEDR